MVDRVAADNPAVETERATVERVGRTSRPIVVLPDGFEVPERPVRLVLDGQVHHARIERALDGTPSIRTAFDDVALVRDGTASEAGTPNRLAEWVQAAELEFGQSVLVDVVEAGWLYGLRAPGESAVYEVGTPDEGLANIAADIERLDGEDAS